MTSTNTKNARIQSPVLTAERTKLWSTVILRCPREDPEPSSSNSKPGFCPGRAITSGGDVLEPASVLRTVRRVARGAWRAGDPHRRAPRQRDDVEHRRHHGKRGGDEVRGGGAPARPRAT